MEQSEVEYHGVYAVQCLTGLNSKYLELRLGPRDATLRRGCFESALWRVQRVRSYQLYGDLLPAARDCPTLYSLNESAKLVGVGKDTFLRIAPPTRAFATPADGERGYPLWPEPILHCLRKQIASGSIAVNWRSLTRPKAGVSIVPPRHVLAESQSNESIAYSKANAWVDLVA